MIKHLSGEIETVEYDSKRAFLLYDNHENEPYPVHWHDAFELIMPLENDYTVFAGETEYNIPVYDILIIPPGELHHMPPIPGHRLILQCDNSALSGIAAIEAVMSGINSPLLINREYSKDLHSLAKKTLLDVYSLNDKKDSLSDVKIYVSLINLLTSVREHQLSVAQQMLSECEDIKIDEYNEKFNAVMKFIDTNYMYDISLDRLANVAGYSKYHFSRIFKHYNSMSYLQYINARRTKAAEHLLLEPELSITDVAMQSGFKSLTTFNRIFKEIKHCTPTDFKRLYSAH